MKDKHGGKLVFQSQNYTVYSDQPGVYYCIAKNEISEKSSDSVDLFNRAETACPQNSRAIEAQRRQSHPDNRRLQPHTHTLPASNISTVYCTVALAPGQAPTAQKPARPQGGHTQEDSLNYASLHFWNQPKNKHVKTEEDAVYAKVSKPLKTNEMQEYENVRITHASKPPNPLDDDTDTDSDTSEDEVALNYSQVTFTAKPGHQRADTDSSTSDDDEIQYSAVKV
ncbi:B-cell receptor CD22-like isoform X1 [Lates japonicus]|uniref:B-cell receptor CD22-like isoform X1 n=1 Tax=Lates japonicus TaxID=270547 RepID=A0AAD3RMV6_LATJO|nr:B-cell receptor CD22-like isoform X1 [Lates japonicus]